MKTNYFLILFLFSFVVLAQQNMYAQKLKFELKWPESTILCHNVKGLETHLAPVLNKNAEAYTLASASSKGMYKEITIERIEFQNSTDLENWKKSIKTASGIRRNSVIIHVKNKKDKELIALKLKNAWVREWKEAENNVAENVILLTDEIAELE
ncbi:MAG: hypothetical protein CSA05_02600 [Bacteroidia bacterium]|nr:MAG: hypothetical protein CSA05_02600 [Bacteroidia bacterium]